MKHFDRVLMANDSSFWGLLRQNLVTAFGVWKVNGYQVVNNVDYKFDGFDTILSCGRQTNRRFALHDKKNKQHLCIFALDILCEKLLKQITDFNRSKHYLVYVKASNSVYMNALKKSSRKRKSSYIKLLQPLNLYVFAWLIWSQFFVSLFFPLLNHAPTLSYLTYCKL